MYQQLSLLEESSTPIDSPLVLSMNEASLEILDEYRTVRLQQGASTVAIKREISMLRTLARQATATGLCEASLLALVQAPSQVAMLLVEPPDDVAHGTVRARLIAFQRLLTIVGPRFGRNPHADLEILAAQLPRSRAGGWHTAGVRVGGSKARRRSPGPVLAGTDLDGIVRAAGSTARPTRDRLLVALHCFSGLRPQEIVLLTWEQFIHDALQPDGRFGLVVAVRRGLKALRLMLPEIVRDAVDKHASATGPLAHALSGPVFIASQRTGRPLGYRGARKVLEAACGAAGFPAMTSAELRAAYGHWLISQGLSDHETTQLLGIEHARTMDRLLHRHRQLDAQRQVREVLDR